MENTRIRLPAEWERHEATWINWPANEDNWPGKMEAVAWAFCEIIRVVSAGETVHVVVADENTEDAARQMLQDSRADMDNIRLHIAPSNYGWMRDCGPQFVLRDNKPAIVDFHFNGWARYSDWQYDNALPAAIAGITGAELVETSVAGKNFVLEGGAVDVNGRGTLITTRECLLADYVQPRNPGLNEDGYAHELKDYLGIDKIIWLNRGIEGDDTHGHVDDICRFVNEKTIVACREKNLDDLNYLPLNQNWEILGCTTLADGTKPELVSLPMPAPLYYKNQRLPASYANFYICNSAVLVPTFNDPKDRIALGILSELFPGRPVVGIHSVDIILGLGSIHCLTRQQPL